MTSPLRSIRPLVAAAITILAFAGALVSADRSPAATTVAHDRSDRSSLPGKWWLNGTGMRVFYMCEFEDGPPWNEITAEIPQLHARGHRALNIFTPYHGEPSLKPDGTWNDPSFCGLAPLDYYHTDPRLGSDADFDRMMRVADRYGMAVMMWINLGYSSQVSDYWKRAQADKAAGRLTKYSGSFRWSETGTEELPADCECSWNWSEAAGAYYAQQWENNPEFDWAQPYWPREAARILRYWIHRGIDGFVQDDGSHFLGITPRHYRTILNGIPRSYGNVLSVPENATGDPDLWGRQLGFTHVYDNEGLSWTHDFLNFATTAITTHDARGIEPHLRRVHDVALSQGGGTYYYQAFTEEFTPRLTSAQRVQEAALSAAAGILLEIDPINAYVDPATSGQVDAVLRAVNSTPALAPGASRRQLATDDERSSYAMLRTSRDGRKRALAVFNVHSATRTIRVDLAGTGVRPQRPVNLMPGASPRRITGRTYEITLPPHGFALLSVR